MVPRRSLRGTEGRGTWGWLSSPVSGVTSVSDMAKSTGITAGGDSGNVRIERTHTKTGLQHLEDGRIDYSGDTTKRDTAKKAIQ